MGVGCSKTGKEFDGKDTGEEIVFERVLLEYRQKKRATSSPPCLLQLCLETLAEHPSLLGMFLKALPVNLNNF